MNDLLEVSSYFGLTITLLMYALSVKLQNRFKLAILNPILISSAVIIIILLLMDIDYATYETGASFISKLLTPATICYAVPLYRQVKILKENYLAIIISVLCGSISSILLVLGFSRLFQFDTTISISILPKSVTTAIAVGIVEEMGGIVPIIVGAVAITGILGSAAAVFICRIFRITDSVAKGIAIGTSSHAMGTAKAIELGDIEGAMSGLALVIAGLLTVILAPIAANFM